MERKAPRRKTIGRCRQRETPTQRAFGPGSMTMIAAECHFCVPSAKGLRRLWAFFNSASSFVVARGPVFRSAYLIATPSPGSALQQQSGRLTRFWRSTDTMDSSLNDRPKTDTDRFAIHGGGGAPVRQSGMAIPSETRARSPTFV